MLGKEGRNKQTKRRKEENRREARALAVGATRELSGVLTVEMIITCLFHARRHMRDLSAAGSDETWQQWVNKAQVVRQSQKQTNKQTERVSSRRSTVTWM
jgi:hypothetical protein